MLKYFFVFIVGLSFGTFAHLPYKFFVRDLYGQKFGRLVYLCDSAMREHFISKNRLLENMDEVSIEDLESSEIALLDCHEYDKLRKKLIIFGLNEADLSLMSLLYIEEKSKDLIEVIKTHEINN